MINAKIVFTSSLLLLMGIQTAVVAQGKSASVAPVSLGAADTLFYNGQWEKARLAYEANTRKNPEKVLALTWNRLGYSYHNLGNYTAAIKNYKKAVDAKPTAFLKPFLSSRLARSYARLNDREQALAWLDSAVNTGYSNLYELDTLQDYNPIRSDPRFKARYAIAYAAAYPCSANPKNREFDFWIGEWDVYQAGTTSPKIGHSLIQKVSGGCTILENWTALSASHEGKSINYYDPATGLWEQDWLGSDGNPVHFVKGEYKDGAMRFVFDAVQPDGKKFPGRFIFFNEGPDQVRQFNEQSPDGGKTWQTNYDYVYVRIK